MTCKECNLNCQRFGKHRNGLSRFRCPQCKRTYTEPHEQFLGGMQIPQEKALLAAQLLVEGNSLKSTQRITGMDVNTIMKLLVQIGEKCEKIMGKHVRNVQVQDIECDEIWAFIGKKEGHKQDGDPDEFGDCYCFVGVERNSKLVLNFALGKRDQKTTDVFIEGLRDAIAPTGRFQITTDGFVPYISAITTTLGHRVDFARLIKVYGAPRDGEAKYSPAEVKSVEVVPVIGNPIRKRICTSIVERQNLTIRMQMRRLTRLTNAFSKKFDNLWAAYCLHFAYYNFCRIHKSLRVTPAMEAGITDHVWDLSELLA